MPEKPDYRQAIVQVEHFLQQFAPKGTTPKIYDYFGGESAEREQHPWCGVRVAEVSFVSNRSGCAFMQTDLPHGLAVCAQVERCILAILEGWDMTEGGDGHEEFWRLSTLFKGE